ncbi:MAG: DUF1043 family protein [Cellvibrionaceae bacterium]|nr:DUF1043 family protein [Cellvibrionaceae bacterium]
MFTLTTLLTVAVIALAGGFILGALSTRVFSADRKRSQRLESRLQQADTTLQNYQQQVTQHFSETANLVNNLTQSYKEVHQHLANNALKLANVDISRQLVSNRIDQEAFDNDSAPEEDFQPPKDWAPKSGDQEGLLSESYGLNDDAQPKHEQPTSH